MQKHAISAFMAGALLVGCGSASQPATEVVETENMHASAEACPDDGPRLPLSGVCIARGENYVEFDDGPRPESEDGCEWVLNEVGMIDQVLLYMGYQCGDKGTKLEFSAGAEAAELSLVSQARGGVGDLPEDSRPVLARVYINDGADKQAGVLARVRDAIDDPAESKRCAIRPAKIEGWPSDALVVEDPTVVQPKDEIGEGSCGPFGMSPDAAVYWRIVGDYAFFFDLGQDVVDIDPGSFTIVPMAQTAADGESTAK